jgi:hypothetical protein
VIATQSEPPAVHGQDGLGSGASFPEHRHRFLEIAHGNRSQPAEPLSPFMTHARMDPRCGFSLFLRFLMVIVSLAAGSLIGEFLRIEERLDRLGRWLGRRLSKDGEGVSKK